MLNPLDMTGKTVLVTGASSGIGRATAILLSQVGAKVILVARDYARLQETLSQMEGSGHAIESYDLTQYEGIPAWMKEVSARHGLLSGCVHSAGVKVTSPLKNLNLEAVAQEWRINVSAALWLAKGFRQRGVIADEGSVVFISSVMGIVGQTAVAGYSACKGALISMARSLAMELAREKIRVNCISPGQVLTEMGNKMFSEMSMDQVESLKKLHPLGFGDPVDVANGIVYLLSPASKWVTGTNMVVDGGYTAH